MKHGPVQDSSRLFLDDLLAFAKRWPVWLACALACYGAILVLVYAKYNWLADAKAPPLSYQACYGLAFAMYSAAMAFAVPAFFLRFAQSRCSLLDALQPSAYGVFLVHYIFIIWLQYDYSFPAFVKFAVVFVGTLSLSWGLIVKLRKNPVVARMI